MGVTIIVNKVSVAHKGSNGISIAFPDVCKTPSPAGPIPIPYPNIAKSSDTSKGSKTVKMDGQPIMLKGSNFMMSTGDEAGSLLGIVSNKIKGKAEFVNYSFDVKVDGKNVCRLLDPMQQNMGSPGNGFSPAEIQANLVAKSPRFEACGETNKKMEQQKDSPETRWGNSGIIEEHREPIQEFVNEEGLILFFRQTKEECEFWIKAGHEPKPHTVLSGTTITKKNIDDVREWLEKRARKDADLPSSERKIRKTTNIAKTSKYYTPYATFYFGIVKSARSQPLPARTYKYKKKEKWITGDYDLFDIMEAGDKCERIKEDGFLWYYIKDELNERMGWDGIQHGPQAQWEPTSKELKKGLPAFSMPDKIMKSLKTKEGEYLRDNYTEEAEFAPGRPKMKAIDVHLTVVAANNVQIYLEEIKEVKDALICCGCAEE